MPYTIEFKHRRTTTWRKINVHNTLREASAEACAWFARNSSPGDLARIINGNGKVVTEYDAGVWLPEPVYAKVPPWVGDGPGGEGPALNVTWERIPRFMGNRDTHYADYLMRDAAGRATGFEVHWCGHPTALRKYYVVLPNGESLEHEMGSIAAFRTVGLAKNAAEDWLRTHPVKLASPSANRTGQLELFAA